MRSSPHVFTNFPTHHAGSLVLLPYDSRAPEGWSLCESISLPQIFHTFGDTVVASQRSPTSYTTRRDILWPINDTLERRDRQNDWMVELGGSLGDQSGWRGLLHFLAWGQSGCSGVPYLQWYALLLFSICDNYQLHLLDILQGKIVEEAFDLMLEWKRGKIGFLLSTNKKNLRRQGDFLLFFVFCHLWLWELSWSLMVSFILWSCWLQSREPTHPATHSTTTYALGMISVCVPSTRHAEALGTAPMQKLRTDNAPVNAVKLSKISAEETMIASSMAVHALLLLALGPTLP